MKYPFKMEPYAHQLEALERSWDKPEYGLFLEMGLGKSMVIVVNAAMLFDAGKITGLLIIAPKGVYRNWTNREIPEHIPDHIPYRIATWNAGLNKKTKAEINLLFNPNDDLNILVMNIDALITKNGKMVADKFIGGRNTMMVIDESSKIKSVRARRTQAAIRMGEKARYRRILTGSPVTKSPLDVFSQCEFLNPHLLGFSSYYSFRGHYATLVNANYGGRTFKQVVGFQNTEELQKSLAEFTFRKTKDECLDLPPKIFIKRDFDMTKEQAKVYDEMKRHALAFWEDEELSSTSVLVQLLRLHQISCGHFPTDDGKVIPLKNNRIAELMDVIEETDGKMIIWANYRPDIFTIRDTLQEKFPDQTVMYFGDTKDEDREMAITQFQDPTSNTRFFLGNTQTGGFGITLTEARTVVYYSNNHNLENRLQSEDRAHRIGLEHAVTYVDLVCRNTIDEKIIHGLRNKMEMATAVTGDKWKEWI